MPDNRWQLKELAEFFFLLIDSSDPPEKDILQKRFKKDQQALQALYDLIEKIDELGYSLGVDFAFKSERFDTIKGTSLSLIEIRRFDKTWRVVTYWSKSQEAFVLLDAFRAHEGKSMKAFLEEIKPRIEGAVCLLGEDE